MHTVAIFFVKAPAATEFYTLSLHDALPICFFGTPKKSCPVTGLHEINAFFKATRGGPLRQPFPHADVQMQARSEEHTSELQSRQYLVCRPLLEKKKSIP